jgi:type IV secretion system protein VirB8
MNELRREALDAYYAEAASWNGDRLEALRSSRRIAWAVALIAAAVALFEAVALALLTPLKTVEPYTLLVDRTTGFVQAVDPLDPPRIAGDAALTQSFLMQYVTAREGFDVALLRINYRKTALFSAGAARNDYLASMQPSDPRNPLAIYPRSAVLEARIKSISAIGPGVALVRFDTVLTEAGGRPRPARAWLSIIHYRYSGEPMKLEDRLVNPLGFQVLRYRKSAETAAALAEQQPATGVQGPAADNRQWDRPAADAQVADTR